MEGRDGNKRLGGDANWEAEGRSGGQDSRKEIDRETLTEIGDSKSSRIASFISITNTAPHQVLEHLQRESNSATAHKHEPKPWTTDTFDNVDANGSNSTPSQTGHFNAPYSPDEAVESYDSSRMQLWPSIPDETPLPDENPADSTALYSPLGVETELEEQTMSKEIHILGMGVVGKFIAHGLASLANPPPITLLMNRPLLMQQWHDEGAAIQLLREGRVLTKSGFNIESAANFRREKPNQRFAAFGPNLEHSAEPPQTPITTLIVTTAPKVTIPALMTVRNRIRPASTICIVGGGMGIIEGLNNFVFPDPQRRPTYILGYVARAPFLSATDRNFSIVQGGEVSVICSKLPRKSISPGTQSHPSIVRTDFSWPLPASYLVGLLARVPEFQTRTVGDKSFYKDQLLRLAVSSVVGPLSVLHDCTNSELLMSYNAKVVMGPVLEEISKIIRSLPELQSLAKLDSDFAPSKLQKRVKSSLIRNANFSSAMLQDVNAGRRTDIDYTNGYLLTRAAELGIDCPINEMLINVVKGKQMIKSRIAEGKVPFLNGEKAM